MSGYGPSRQLVDAAVCLQLWVKPTCRLSARTSQFDPERTDRAAGTLSFTHPIGCRVHIRRIAHQ